MGKIVVGCDGSPSAADAVAWAAREGDVRGWSVTALYAWDYLRQPTTERGRSFNPRFGDDEARQVLQRSLHDALGERAPAVQPAVVCDLPARALLEASAAADLLVVGARGVGGVRGAVLGSVSQQCVHHSKVPVAIVRGASRPEAKRIVVAIDGSDGARRALAWAIEAAGAHACELTVLHAWHPAPSTLLTVPAALAVPTAWPDMTGMQSDADALIDRALSRAETRGLDPTRIRRHAVCGNVIDVVLDEAREAEMLVVGSRGRGGFAGLLLGSVSHHLVHHATCPVVVVPSPR